MSTRLLTIMAVLGAIGGGLLAWGATSQRYFSSAPQTAPAAAVGSGDVAGAADPRIERRAAGRAGRRTEVDESVQQTTFNATDDGDNGFSPRFSKPPTSAESSQLSLRVAQAAAPPAEPAKKSPDRYRFTFRAAPWEQVLTSFAIDANLALQMDVVPDGTFNYIDSAEYTITEALDILNGYLMQKGYILLRRDRFLVVTALRPNQPIPLQLIPPVKIEDLDKYGRNELLSIAVPVVNIDPASAANEVRQLLSPIGRVSVFGSDRIVIIDMGQNLRRINQLLRLNEVELSRRPYAVFRLKHTPAEEVARAIANYIAAARGGSSFAGAPPAGPISGPGSGLPGVSTPLPGLSPGGPLEPTVVAQKETNCLLVSSPPKYLKMIEDLITKLDAPPPQVLIQAMLVEVELANTDEFGVELGIQDPVLFDRSIIDNILTVTQTVSDPASGIATTDQTIVSQSGTPGFPFNNRPLGNNIAINPSRVGTQGLSNFALGRTNGALGFGGLVLSASSDQVSVLIRALAARRKVNVLSRPQIRAINNQEAKIQVGQRVPVVNGVSISPVGTANPQIVQDDAGIILKVTPRIGPHGEVTIAVVAEKSAFRTGPGNGVPIFVDATNGNVIEAPIKDLTTAQTSVSVQTGQTIVLGGIITKDTVSSEDKIPFLGDLPWVGALFRHNLDIMQRRELLIFLTPHVIVSDLHSDTIRDVETQRLQFPYGDAEQLHGPIAEYPHHYITPEGAIISYPETHPGAGELALPPPAAEEVPAPPQGWGRGAPMPLPAPTPKIRPPSNAPGNGSPSDKAPPNGQKSPSARTSSRPDSRASLGPAPHRLPTPPDNRARPVSRTTANAPSAPAAPSSRGYVLTAADEWQPPPPRTIVAAAPAAVPPSQPLSPGGRFPVASSNPSSSNPSPPAPQIRPTERNVIGPHRAPSGPAPAAPQASLPRSMAMPSMGAALPAVPPSFVPSTDFAPSAKPTRLPPPPSAADEAALRRPSAPPTIAQGRSWSPAGIRPPPAPSASPDNKKPSASAPVGRSWQPSTQSTPTQAAPVQAAPAQATPAQANVAHPTSAQLSPMQPSAAATVSRSEGRQSGLAAAPPPKETISTTPRDPAPSRPWDAASGRPATAATPPAPGVPPLPRKPGELEPPPAPTPAPGARPAARPLPAL